MKNFILYFLTLAFVASFTSCEDDLIYSGRLHAKFQGTSGTFYVEDKADASYDVIVQLVGNPQNKDIKVKVSIVDSLSTAKEGVDYHTISETVTIPAGSNLGALSIKGIYAGVETKNKKLVINLESGDIPITTTINQFTVNMTKYCAWVKSDFIGTWAVTEKSAADGGTYNYEMIVKEGLGDTLIAKGIYAKGSEVTLVPIGFEMKFIASEPSKTNYLITVPKQYLSTQGSDGDFFIEQYDNIRNFSPCGGLTVTLRYKIYNAEGAWDILNPSKWTKISSSTGS